MHDTKKRLFDSIECLALQIYEGEVEPWLMSDYCTDTVPVLLRRATFCRAFAADAKDFRSYNSWVGPRIILIVCKAQDATCVVTDSRCIAYAFQTWSKRPRMRRVCC